MAVVHKPNCAVTYHFLNIPKVSIFFFFNFVTQYTFRVLPWFLVLSITGYLFLHFIRM